MRKSTRAVLVGFGLAYGAGCSGNDASTSAAASATPVAAAPAAPTPAPASAPTTPASAAALPNAPASAAKPEAPEHAAPHASHAALQKTTESARATAEKPAAKDANATASPSTAPPPSAPPSPSAPAAPAAHVSVPRTDHVHIDVPDGLQKWLDADTRMQPWVEQVMSVADRCYASVRSQSPDSKGVIEVVVTMHKDERPDADIKALPPQLSGVVACATGDLIRTRMPLFTGAEGERHAVRIHFE